VPPTNSPTASAATTPRSLQAYAAATAPHSSPANATATWQMPPLACDSHMHIFDEKFAPPDVQGRVESNATVADYRPMQKRLGTTRTVIVNGRPYGVSNAVTVNAIAQLGKANARGVAVLQPDVTDAELRRLHEAGIRGIRFTLYSPAGAPTRFDMVEALAARVHAFGWHVQLHWNPNQIVEHQAMLDSLPCRIVFDHLARLPLPMGIAHPAFGVVRKLLDAGNTWVKVSGPYLDSRVGEAGGFVDTDPVAQGFVQAAPERLVWGSDWPYTTESVKPAIELMRDVFFRWVPDVAIRRRILVENPATLYGFDTD
jgi:D-galactarolactone isomerase